MVGWGTAALEACIIVFFHTENPKMYLFLKSFQHCYSIIMGVATCHSCPVYYGDQAHDCVHIQGQVLDHDQAKDHYNQTKKQIALVVLVAMVASS